MKTLGPFSSFPYLDSSTHRHPGSVRAYSAKKPPLEDDTVEPRLERGGGGGVEEEKRAE